MSATSLDTNVLLALWNREPHAPHVAAALDRLQARGRVVVCGAVYGELIGLRSDLDALLGTYGIVADPDMPLRA